jgi:hypothetical protein
MANLAGTDFIVVQAGPIWNNNDAQTKCPKATKAKNCNWNKQWWTTIPNKMSVCECTKDINAGPIWNNGDAKKKCPNVCKANGGLTFTGAWKTTVPNKMSVCNCK